VGGEHVCDRVLLVDEGVAEGGVVAVDEGDERALAHVADLRDRFGLVYRAQG
jgi:hypothetical protein